MGVKQYIFSLFFLLTGTLAMGQEFKCVENTCISKTDIISGQPVYKIADKMPKYPGGMEALYKHIAKNIKHYGEGSRYGKMFITFVVDTSGYVRNECIIKSCFLEGIYYKEEEVLDVFRQLVVWQPGEHKSKKVPVRFELPIAF